MAEATQATQSLPDFDSAEDEAPKEKVWGRLISLNPVYDNVELTGTFNFREFQLILLFLF